MRSLLLTFKRLDQAKQRLVPVLSEPERREMARQMLLDLIRALQDCRSVFEVSLVSADRWAGRLVEGLGWRWLREETQGSESQSVDWASAVLSASGAESILRLPCDVPLIRGEDVDQLLEVEVPHPGALIVPSGDRDGTNALLRRPPRVFPSRFGPDSFRRHREEAENAGIPLRILENQRIGLDIDEPADLIEFMRLGSGTGTFEFLEEIGVSDRLRGSVQCYRPK